LIFSFMDRYLGIPYNIGIGKGINNSQAEN
jgi:hypothetical protein